MQKSQSIKKIESSSLLQKSLHNNIAVARNMFEKDNNDTNEQRNKQVELIKKVEEPSNENEDPEDKIIQNKNKVESVSPPKPLPRRTGSLSESEEVPVQKPVARPRTNSVISTTAPLSVPVTTPHSSVNVQIAYKVIIVKFRLSH